LCQDGTNKLRLRVVIRFSKNNWSRREED
jgi:hypothetical protein